MIRNLFGKGSESAARERRTVLSGTRMPRHSSGWSALKKHLASEPGLRVLDIGPTSSANINFLTGMGHGVWMADLVHESHKSEWETPPHEEGAQPGFNAQGFFEQNLNFGGREFDVVLLWTTLDYIPEGLVAPLIEKLHASLRPGGRILAIFHTRSTGPDTAFCRYHLTDTDAIEMQESEPFRVRRVYTNRNIEKLFSAFSNYRFFLAKDNFYEVIITR